MRDFEIHDNAGHHCFHDGVCVGCRRMQGDVVTNGPALCDAPTAPPGADAEKAWEATLAGVIAGVPVPLAAISIDPATQARADGFRRPPAHDLIPAGADLTAAFGYDMDGKFVNLFTPAPYPSRPAVAGVTTGHDEEAGPGKRWVRVFLSRDAVLSVAGLLSRAAAGGSEDFYPPAAWPDLPPDARIEGVNFDYELAGFVFTVSHPSFPLTPPGERLPAFPPRPGSPFARPLMRLAPAPVPGELAPCRAGLHVFTADAEPFTQLCVKCGKTRADLTAKPRAAVTTYRPERPCVKCGRTLAEFVAAGDGPGYTPGPDVNGRV
jgi:hypothetical protein